MDWILAVTLLASNGQLETLANNFSTEQECVREMRLTIKAMEAHDEKIDSASCTQGIVISAIDDEE
jgi:hypothetical protein